MSGKAENPQAQQDAIIRRYGKRIRKTHKVANQTDDRLRQQQTALLHFKKELSRHIVKLVELANSGEPQATKRLKNIRVKLQQLDKIVPYLGKYIAVNRQAEMQTVAVLKESCRMEVESVTRKSPARDNLKAGPRGHRGASPLSKSLKTEGIKEEENENGEQLEETADEPTTAAAESATRESGEVTVATSEDRTSVIEEVVASTSTVVVAEENPYASLSEIRPKMEAEKKPMSNYAQLHFGHSSDAAKIRPPSVNYCEVQICHGGRNMILTPDAVEEAYHRDRMEQHPPTIEEEPQENGEELSLQDTTLTPENAAFERSTSPKLSISPRRPSSPVPPPSHPPPPPPTEESPIHVPPSFHTPPVSPVSHSEATKENGGLDSSTVASSPMVIPGQSASAESELRRAESMAKSQPPPVAKKPNSKQSTPVHKANTLNHSPSHVSSQNGVEASTAEKSNELSLSPTHKDMVSIMGNAPSLMDRIKVCTKKNFSVLTIMYVCRT